MDDLAADKNIDTNSPPENSPAEKNPGHSTGPTSKIGKARSSMNRLTHGCRSERTVLPDEDPEQFEFFSQAWRDCYQPADDLAEMLVEETALAYWKFKRNCRRLDETEDNLPQHAFDWRDFDHQNLALFTRYKTTTERAFHRWFKELEAHYSRIHRREHLDKIAAAKMAAAEMK